MSGYDDRLGDYNDVASRMREFFEKYPEGRLRPAGPWRVQTIGGKEFVVYEAAAYRAADDPNPGIGTAWEPFPGRTSFTKDSELMNAETSAWGRAILAIGAADTKKGIASREEVRNRQADRDQQWESAKPAHPAPSKPEPSTGARPEPVRARQRIVTSARKAIADATERDALDAIGRRIDEYHQGGQITGDNAVELKRLLLVRTDELFPAGEQAAIEGDWPPAEKPGSRDPA